MKIYLGQKIKELRKKANISQANLARKIGVSPSAIGMYEQNRRTPDNETMLKLCSFFDVSLDYLVGSAVNYESFSEYNDVADMLDEFAKKLCEQEGLMFDGSPLNREERIQILQAIRYVSKVAEKMKYEDGGI